MLSTVARQQIVAATSATLSFQGVDSDGEPADPGVVTVTVSTSAGVAILTGAATSGTGTDPRTVALTAAQTESIDQLTAVWSDATPTVLATTLHDVLGAPLITFADFKRRQPKRVGESLADFKLARLEVDAMFRRVTRRSFVRRFDVETLPGNRPLLSHPDLVSVSWANDANGDTVDVSDVPASPAGIADLGRSSAGLVTIGYVHGMIAPPDDVVGAAAEAIAAKLVEGRSSVPARADSFSTELGAATFTPRAGYGKAHTAIDSVDEVLNGYRWHVSGIA